MDLRHAKVCRQNCYHVLRQGLDQVERFSRYQSLDTIPGSAIVNCVLNRVSSSRFVRIVMHANIEDNFPVGASFSLSYSDSGDHEVTPIRKRPKEASTLMPRVHLVVSLLKRWLAHQGGVSHEHLPYYLDEFTFRFNRRKSKSRGKLFFRLVQQAVDTGPTTYASIAKPSKLLRSKSQSVGAT